VRKAVLTLAALLALWPSAAWAGRHLAILVDTSGSMRRSDPARYTVQISKILADLLAPGDELTFVRLPRSGSCADGPSGRLALRLDPADRGGFKGALDALVDYGGDNQFAAPIRTALAALPSDPSAQRLLLLVADSGGLGGCDSSLTRDLLALHRTGGLVAAINLGSTAGAFDANPAFDFTTAALDAEQLVQAVALVYQRFLGAKRVQTGRVEGPVEVQVAPFVDEAFLVVAADGTLSEVVSERGNPTAAAIDVDHRGGGETRGHDGRIRGYRIVRLERPAAGRWSFEVPNLTATAGWMFLQDSALTVRLLTPSNRVQGVPGAVEVEVTDRRTGERIADPAALADLSLSFEAGGQRVPLRDDGTGGDRQPGDGVFSATSRFEEAGRHHLPVHLETDLLDLTAGFAVEVTRAAWRLAVKTPPRSTAGQPVGLAVALEALGSEATLQAPERIDALAGGATTELRDDGTGADRQAGDRLYTGLWTPPSVGSFAVDYEPSGGTSSPPVTALLEVVGSLTFGDPVPIDLGPARSGSQVPGVLDLTSARVRGSFEVEATTDLALRGSRLEIESGEGWVPLGAAGQRIALTEAGPRSWPLRLTVGRCPEAAGPGRFEIRLRATGPGDEALASVVPVKVEVAADRWLVCWWPVLAAGIAAAVAGITVYGFVSPSRFPPRLGVVLSPEEDLAEGFFHPVRAQRGSGSGFFRDARVFIRPDFRLSASPRGSIARLRAHDSQVRLLAMPGGSLLRLTAEGSPEPLPQREVLASFGATYRTELGDLFFAVRNG
jgi:hypothetical protein